MGSHIEGNRPTVVYVHGFGETAAGAAGQSIKNAYLRRGTYNVILVDWSQLAALPWYSVAVKNCQVVGWYLAMFLQYLHSRGLHIHNFHIIGFSLGAEVAGFTGQYLSISTGMKLARITGLDPAYPLFNYANKGLRLSREDAHFVDVIHTDSGIFGHPWHIGHADFFPNGGRQTQPGCDMLSILLRASFEDLFFCSHKRAWKYYAESVNNELGFVSVRCRNWVHFILGVCSPDIAFMGIAASSSARGKYFLRTNPNSPYAQNSWTTSRMI
ncbi:Pancreatic lipase-related protein 2 [Blattella germanica]|nr:Pancreatic lipase-related protein 2 [Blattella germanica]